VKRTTDQIVPKLVDRTQPVERRGKPVRCEEPGCNRTTREGKPYCSHHVERLEYVARLIEERKRREAEAAAVAKGRRRADPCSVIAKEMLVQLRVHGPRTAARLSRTLNEDFDVVQRYARALKRAGVVSLSYTRRGSMTLHLREAEAA
jgi:hypothetical protein